ncbi:MAG: hypothetical protein IKN84_01460 [Bacteroidales bacterium]|nr:hypothetical protein [Bacteroidales bacterium]
MKEPLSFATFLSGSGERKVEERADEEDKMKKEEKKKEMLIDYKRKKC